MHPRQSVIEIFSTFLQFEVGRVSGWVTDPKLYRSMKSYLDQSLQPQTLEKFWALYWYKAWQSDPMSLARFHLIAYLQETCYWISQKLAVGNFCVSYTVSDYFQVTMAQFDKVLTGFNPNHGITLKNYASVVFNSLVRETLRQRSEVDICTPWALLLKLSQKRLVESLQVAGFNSETIATYVKAWKCFKTLYVPTQVTATRQLSRPDSKTWKAITSLYNSQDKQQSNLGTLQCQPDILEKWLLNCVKAARAYLYPTLIPTDTLIMGQESGELLDNLVSSASESLLSEIISQEEEQERYTQQTQINTILVSALAQLEPQAQSLLQLYYTQDLTQQQIAQQMGIKQYTISRKLTKARQPLLFALAQWSRDALHISLDSDTLKSTSTVLEEWLKVYYSQSLLAPSYSKLSL